MASKQTTVVLADLLSPGHHATYMFHLAEALLKLNCRVFIFFPKTEKLRQLFKASSFFNNVTVLPIREDTSLPENRLKVFNRWRRVKHVIRQQHLKPDLVFLTWVDDFRFRKDHPLLDKIYLKWVEWFFPYKWSGLYFHPVHLRIADNNHNNFPGYDIDDVFKLKNCTSVCILDKEIRKMLNEKIHNPVIRFPDFTDDMVDQSSVPATHLRQAADGRKIILLLGALLKRKGILTFLEAASHSVEKPWLFALAGKIFESDFSEKELKLINDQISHPGPNVWFYTDHLAEPDFNAMVNACDIMYAAYFRFPHTSNMLNKASIFHKPLIVARGFYMDETVTRLKMGEVIDEANPAEAKAAIEKILESENYINGESLKGFETYHMENAVEKLQEGFDEVLRAAKIL